MWIGQILGKYMLILILLIFLICSLLSIVDCCIMNEDKVRGVIVGVQQVV